MPKRLLSTFEDYYHRLVDSAFQTQLGRNLEAYEDDKDHMKADISARDYNDIAKTFDISAYAKIDEKLRAKLFLSRFRGTKALPHFLNTNKITKENKEDYQWMTKENKDDYQWMEKAERALQEMKKLILELLTLTTPALKEVLSVYLATSQDAISGLAKYVVELGAYNITYVPQNTIKGQVLTDFINGIPVGTEHIEICSLADEEAKMEEWTLYTDGASSLKGVGAGLVLIDPTGVEYTYALRLNFPSTNNEAEYEALLAGFLIANKMKVQALKVKVDSKLVACQLNGEFIASNEGMTKYLTKAKEHVALFKKFSIQNIP
ncbi:reverse transcriptase domain-containing protein [Tanacetum coccineum]